MYTGRFRNTLFMLQCIHILHVRVWNAKYASTLKCDNYPCMIIIQNWPKTTDFFPNEKVSRYGIIMLTTNAFLLFLVECQ